MKSEKRFFDPEEILIKLGLREGYVMLDGGCGKEGRFSIPASNIVGKKGRIYAIDISEEAVKELIKKLKEKNIHNIETSVGDIGKELPIMDKSVDFYLMSNIFHGLVSSHKAPRALEEAVRVLKSGGILGIVDFKKIDSHPGPPLSIRLSPSEIEKIVEDYAFEKKNFFEAGLYHYAIAFLKR